MMRTFRLTFVRPVPVSNSGGGHRHAIVIRAEEPAEALRYYRQDYPDGPEPDQIAEVGR